MAGFPDDECAAVGDLMPGPNSPSPWLHLWMLREAHLVVHNALSLLKAGAGGVACARAVDAVARSEMALRSAVAEIKASPSAGPSAACPRCAAPLWLVWRAELQEAWMALCTNDGCASYREPVWLSGTGSTLETMSREPDSAP